MEHQTSEDHYLLGRDCRKRQDYLQAAIHLRLAIALDPNDADAYAELGNTLLCHVGNSNATISEARHALETALKLDPEDGWSRLFLANLFQRTGDFASAHEQFKAVLAMWPDLGLAHIHYGLAVDENFKDYKLAKSHLKKAIALDSTDGLALYSLGNFLCKHNRRKEGEKYLKRAAELGHDQARNLLNRQLEYVPKPQRWQICVECGSHLSARETWWCGECGADLRIKQYQRSHEYHFDQKRMATRPALPR